MFGPGGISPMQLLIILGIVILIFGTAKLKNFGSDLGSAFRGFKKAMSDDEDKDKSSESSSRQARQIESESKPDAEFSEQTEKEKQG